MMKKGLLSVVMCCFGVVAIAQEKAGYHKGYVVNDKGDTLKGEIRVNPKNEAEPFDKVLFQTTPADKKTFRANKTKAYSVNGEKYIAKKLDDKFVFLKELSSGTINFYQYKTESYVMNDIKVFTDYYIQKGNGELQHIKESKLKKTLSDMMSDNPKVIKKLNDNKYDFTTIVEIFEMYNNPETANSTE